MMTTEQRIHAQNRSRVLIFCLIAASVFALMRGALILLSPLSASPLLLPLLAGVAVAAVLRATVFSDLKGTFSHYTSACDEAAFHSHNRMERVLFAAAAVLCFCVIFFLVDRATALWTGVFPSLVQVIAAIPVNLAVSVAAAGFVSRWLVAYLQRAYSEE